MDEAVRLALQAQGEGGWVCHNTGRDVHVAPARDIRPHVLEGQYPLARCWCAFRTEVVNGCFLITHGRGNN